MTAVLPTIQFPTDLKLKTISELEQLASEIRRFIIDVVSVNGGHLGASLGVVELTIALHYVFDTPADKLVWDVGHQAYRSEEHTSELQSRPHLVCRLLL